MLLTGAILCGFALDLLLAGAGTQRTGLGKPEGLQRIWQRDRRNHPSPNSAQTESACAGALGVQLAGPASYFGTVHQKPTIGDPLRPVELEDILRANRMLYASGMLALGISIRTAVCLWLQ